MAHAHIDHHYSYRNGFENGTIPHSRPYAAPYMSSECSAYGNGHVRPQHTSFPTHPGSRHQGTEWGHYNYRLRRGKSRDGLYTQTTDNTPKTGTKKRRRKQSRSGSTESHQRRRQKHKHNKHKREASGYGTGASASASTYHSRKGGATDKKSGSTKYDDSEGHYRGEPGDIIRNRYRVLEESGVGTFGRVLHCEDLERDTKVAVKVIRKIKKYIESAKVESDILRDVNSKDPDGRSLCVRFYEEFEWKGHLWMVFEALGLSVYEYIKRNDFKPLPLYCVQAFADQTTTSVAFLHAMNLVHTDLKPENILLVSREPLRKARKRTYKEEDASVLIPGSTAVKLIDFGGATYERREKKTSIINTRQYRSPEVTLGLGWGIPSDIWSLGCILMECYTGNLLFQTRDSLEHLALMEKVLGPFPDRLAKANTKACRKYFDSRGQLRFPAPGTRQSDIKFVQKQKSLEEIVAPRDEVFLDLIRRMLEFDPKKRITAAEALNHKFFTKVRGTKTPPVPEVLSPPRTNKSFYNNRENYLSSFSKRLTPHDQPKSKRSTSTSPERTRRSRSESPRRNLTFSQKRRGRRSKSSSPISQSKRNPFMEASPSALAAKTAAAASTNAARRFQLGESDRNPRGRYGSPRIIYGGSSTPHSHHHHPPPNHSSTSYRRAIKS